MKTVAKAAWFGQAGAGGRTTAIIPITANKADAKNPYQIARRDAA